MEVILVQTGDKYDDWYKFNMIMMLENLGVKCNTKVIREDRYEGVWNKLLMFEQFKTGSYLYFDLDVVLLNDEINLRREKLTLLHAWWRDKLHTPLNSSVMSWTGDYSHIHDKFAEDPEYFMTKYKGIDEFLYKEFEGEYDTFDPICTSYRYHGWTEEWPIMLFNQRYKVMKEPGPWQRYTLSESETSTGPSTKTDLDDPYQAFSF